MPGSDTHSLNAYKAECRKMLMYGKKIIYASVDDFDLTYKSYDELVEMFKNQGALDESVYLEAIQNTNIVADSVEEFKLDLEFKYPILYGSEEKDAEIFEQRVYEMYQEKVNNKIITPNGFDYINKIKEEIQVLKKIRMCGFMLFMSELAVWSWKEKIPIGFCRGSVGGSLVAYVTDITDVSPPHWNTIFSRFANEDRLEIGDIDIDFAPIDRQKVYDYIINRFTKNYTSNILAIGTCSDKGTIDEIVRGFNNKWLEENSENIKSKTISKDSSKYTIKYSEEIKKSYESNPDKAREKYPKVFYYFNGLLGTTISQSMHPAGIIASPITLKDNYGCFYDKDDNQIICINMEEVHEVSLVKYDVLGLKNIGVIKDTCEYLNIPYPKSHEINWEDKKVWDDILCSGVGLFQFEGNYAFELLKKYQPRKIIDLSLLNAALRPSGASYREKLINREFNHNPSEIIDKLLEENSGFLVFQEDTIKFLQEICGLSGSQADNVRRAIGRKQLDRLQQALPSILEGYCAVSNKPREIAEEEAKAFLQIIEDSSSYQFGKNHSTGYSMIGYLCAWLRYYHPLEFITALLNNANSDEDIQNATLLARIKKIQIKPVRFRHSKSKYFFDKESNCIYKGIASIKGFGEGIGELLYTLRDKKCTSFIDLLIDIKNIGVGIAKIKDLIKLDYFEEFGQSRALDTIVNYFEMFKCGDAKQVSKEKLDNETLKSIVARFSRETAKNYVELKTIDILHELEEYIISLGGEDYTIKQKIMFQDDLQGYIDICTGKPEERYKLLVTDVTALKTKAQNRVFAYKVTAMSFGTGAVNQLKVDRVKFKNSPFDKHDILYCSKESIVMDSYNGYRNWNLNGYRVERG